MSSEQDTSELIKEVAAIGRILAPSEAHRIVSNLLSHDLTLHSDVLNVVKTASLREAVSAQLVRVMRQWQAKGYSAESLGLSLQVAYESYQSNQKANVRLVWTGPATLPEVQARTNLSVLLELIDQAQHEIVIVGYSITDFAEMVFQHLADARTNGVRVVIIANQIEQFVPVIRRHWNADAPLPVLYSRPPSEEDHMSALHAKLAIVDQSRMLVTSANLTYHGLAGNLEIGVVIEDQVAEQAIRLLNHLIETNIIVHHLP